MIIKKKDTLCSKKRKQTNNLLINHSNFVLAYFICIILYILMILSMISLTINKEYYPISFSTIKDFIIISICIFWYIIYITPKTMNLNERLLFYFLLHITTTYIYFDDYGTFEYYLI